MKTLHHPNLVNCLFTNVEKKDIMLVFEHLPSESLSELLAKGDASFPEDTVVNWLVQLVLATSFMHSNQIYHGNINTDNIFVSNGSIKVGQFGLNQYLAMEEPTKAVTLKDFAAPEVRRGTLVHDPRSDVWSIACVIYKLCTSKLPGTPVETLPAKYSAELSKTLVLMLESNTIKRMTIVDLLKSPLVNKHIAEKLVLYSMHSTKLEAPASDQQPKSPVVRLILHYRLKKRNPQRGTICPGRIPRRKISRQRKRLKK